MKVVITSGRNFIGREIIASDLRALRSAGLLRLAATAEGLEVGVYPVDRKLDGPWPAAGPRRSIRMLAAEQPDLVLAYPDELSRRTWHCVRAALARDVAVALWAPWLTATEVLELAGPGYGCADDEPRFVIARAPITPHERCIRIAMLLHGGAA